VLALMGGLSETGAHVARSHTGSVAATEAVVTGLLRRRGVLQAGDFMELVDLAGALATLEVRACGNRVAVLTFSGAAGVVSADLFARDGLVLAELTDDTKARLNDIYPSWLEPENPVDVWSTVELRGLERTIGHSLEALLDDDGVDAILFMPLAFEFFAGADLDAFTTTARRGGKPIVAWLFDQEEHLSVWRRKLHEGGVAVCRSLHAAVRVLEALVRRREALDRLAEPAASAGEGAPAARRDGYATLAALWDGLAVPPADTIGEEDAKRVLAAYGVPVVEERRALTPTDAVAAAEEFGHPVTVKLSAPDLAHKAELAAVALDLETADAVGREAARLLDVGCAHGIAECRLLVQPMVRDGIETIVGARRDAALGPVVVFGIGGIFVETLRDVAVRPAPITRADARAMITELRGARLLEGGRGRPPADVEAIITWLLAMSRLICEAPPYVREAEANPLIVHEAGAVALDSLIVVDPRPY
jgi:acetyltransferase